VRGGSVLEPALLARGNWGAPEQDYVRRNAHLVGSGSEGLEMSPASLHHEQEREIVVSCRGIGGRLRGKQGLRIALRLGWEALQVEVDEVRVAQEIGR
jgi:hypothetical protein